LGVVLMDKDKTSLEKRLSQRYKNTPVEMQREFATTGTPEEVRRQVELLRDAGVEYLITSFEWGRELQGVEQFASEVVKKF